MQGTFEQIRTPIYSNCLTLLKMVQVRTCCDDIDRTNGTPNPHTDFTCATLLRPSIEAHNESNGICHIKSFNFLLSINFVQSSSDVSVMVTALKHHWHWHWPHKWKPSTLMLIRLVLDFWGHLVWPYNQSNGICNHLIFSQVSILFSCQLILVQRKPHLSIIIFCNWQLSSIAKC